MPPEEAGQGERAQIISGQAASQGEGTLEGRMTAALAEMQKTVDDLKTQQEKEFTKAKQDIKDTKDITHLGFLVLVFMMGTIIVTLLTWWINLFLSGYYK